jgi:DNA-binding transcriptional LysR family regulator
MQEIAPSISSYWPNGSPELPLEEISFATTPIELRHLRYFVAVAEHLNFGRAARALHVSQPPLSRQIRDLETYLGVTLFWRNSKGVSLTEAGQILLGESRRILDELALSVLMVRREASGAVGRIPVV